MKIKIIIFSADELRHKFIRKRISSIKNVEVKLCLAEKNSSRQYFKVLQSKNYKLNEKKHFIKRKESEKKYFGKYLKNTKELKSLRIIERGEFNFNKKLVDKIISLKPDLLISYGCSIIKDPILSKFKKKFINIHLGLSPYYKGSATNFWPLVYNEPQFLGVSFLKIDKGVDTGPIIHQIRADLEINDNVHDIGNKLIIKMSSVLEKLILHHKKLKGQKQKKIKKIRIFKKKDYNNSALKKLEYNLKNGIISKYLKNKSRIDKRYPIIEQKL